MKRATNGFDRMGDDAFFAFLNNVCQKMDGNPKFAAFAAKITALIAKRDALQKIMAEAKKGTLVDRLHRDALRAEIADDLRELGALVSGLANNDAAVIAEAGFNYNATATPTEPLVTPRSPNLSLGQNFGELLCRLFGQRGGKTFNLFYTTEPANDKSWVMIPSVPASYVLTGLTGGLRYYIRYQLCGVRNQAVMSPESSFIPQ